jgi:hypothetical protein
MGKKILAFFIILIILGGLGFFFGWAQLKVPPGSYGVMRSKTHGIDPRLIREGEFRWVWFKLIPTNVEITLFRPSAQERSIRITGALPSGDVYGAISGVSPDFSYELSGSLSFNLKPEALPDLLAERGVLTQEDLRNFETKLAGEVAAFTEQRLEVYAADEERIQALLGAGAADQIRGEILAAYPDIENLFCSFRPVRFPDFALYHSVRVFYEEYLDHQRRQLQTEALAGRHLDFQLRLDELAKYGELLTQYPVLLQYLALPQESLPPGSLLPGAARLEGEAGMFR